LARPADTRVVQGLSYSAIIIRVGLGIAERSDGAADTPGAPSQRATSRGRAPTLVRSGTQGDIALKVTVTRHVDSDGDAESRLAELAELAQDTKLADADP
jgi:hypothetical protein